MLMMPSAAAWRPLPGGERWGVSGRSEKRLHGSMEGGAVGVVYEVRVKGHLGGRWSEWFDGLEITNLDNGEAILSGEIMDQAALHGVLAKVRDLGLPLVAVTSVGGEEEMG
jgi:hypothetical protein